MITITVFLKTGNPLHMTFNGNETEYAEKVLEQLEAEIKQDSEPFENSYFDFKAGVNRYVFPTRMVAAVVSERHGNFAKHSGKVKFKNLPYECEGADVVSVDANKITAKQHMGGDGRIHEVSMIGGKLEEAKKESPFIHAEAGDVILINGEKRMVVCTENGIVTETEDLFKYVAQQLFDTEPQTSYLEQIQKEMDKYEVVE